MSKQSSKSSLAINPEMLSKPTINPWVRIMSTSTTPDRTVDVPQIEKLLADRMAAKESKNYDVSDKIAKTLQEMHIAYNDDQKTWYSKPMPTVTAPSKFAEQSKKLTKKQQRNKRQAEKNQRKKLRLESGETGSGLDSESGDDSEEEEKPRQKKAKKN